MQRFLGFFQVLDRDVDALDGLFKAFGGQTPIAAKRRLELVQLGFELRDVHVLRAHQRQLGLVLHRVQSGIAQQRDQGHNELRPHRVLARTFQCGLCPALSENLRSSF